MLTHPQPAADAAALGTAAIVADGCIACMQCHIGQCVTGIATRDAAHQARYKAELEARHIHAFLESVRWQIAALPWHWATTTCASFAATA